MSQLLLRAHRWLAVRRHDVIEKAVSIAAVVLILIFVPGGPAMALGPGMEAVDTLPQVVGNATKWIVGILGTLGVFFFTLGGLRYMAANGDPAETEKAKGAFKGAALGFALALLAPAFVDILKQILGT